VSEIINIRNRKNNLTILLSMEQWFSNLRVPQYFQEDLLKHRLLGLCAQSIQIHYGLENLHFYKFPASAALTLGTTHSEFLEQNKQEDRHPAEQKTEVPPHLS
jgi:hypothetical protein